MFMVERIGLTFDLRTDFVLKEGDPFDKYAEFDHPDTIAEIENAIRDLGYETHRIGNVFSLLNFLNSSDKDKVDFVFNIAEGLEGRNRESQAPTILELFKVPYSGSDALSLGLSLDKSLAKKIFIYDGLPTSKFVIIENLNNVTEKVKNLKFPLIVKPIYEGSSKGINENSIVGGFDELLTQVNFVITNYNQSALVEEFIIGREATVIVIGNNPPIAYQPVQLSVEGVLDLGNKFFASDREHRWDNVQYICSDDIDPVVKDKLMTLAVKAHEAIGCKDLSRVDFRIDNNNFVYILEVNPLPSLSVEDTFSFVAAYEGVNYKQLIQRVLNSSLQRYKMI